MKLILIYFLIFSILNANEIKLTQKEANFIAKKVWQNEGAGKDSYLIWWNKGEDFASLGIGHFIWFHKGEREPFREIFPMLLLFMQDRGVALPKGITPKSACPWQSREMFFRAKRAKRKEYLKLFKFLKRTKSYQAMFMVKRVSEALPKILATLKSSSKKEIIKRRFEKMLYGKDRTIDKRGIYILLDYINFKGEGILKSERYNAKGWGLLQVLEEFNESNPNKYRAFSISAKAILHRRIKNSPPIRHEKRWLKGWIARVDRY